MKTIEMFETNADRLGFRDNTPDGCIIVSLPDRRMVKVGELRSGRELARFDLETDFTTLDMSKNCEFVFGACGQTQVTGPSGYRPGIGRVTQVDSVGSPTVFAWSVAQGRMICNLRCHERNVTRMAINADAKIMASGSLDRQVKLFSLQDGKELATLVGHQAEITELAISQDGHVIVSGERGDQVRVWEIPSGRLLHNLRTGGWGRVTISADGRLLATGNSAAVELWDVRNGSQLRKVPHGDYLPDVIFIAFVSEGQHLVTGGSGFLKVLDSSNGNLVQHFEIKQGKDVQNWVIADDEETIAACTESNVRIYDLFSGKLCDEVTLSEFQPWKLAFTPDSKTLVTSQWSKERRLATIRFWQADGGAWPKPHRSAEEKRAARQKFDEDQARFTAELEKMTLAAHRKLEEEQAARRKAEEERQKVEDDKQKIEHQRKAKIIEQRKQMGQCFWCGEPLGLWARLRGHIQHPNCFKFCE